MEAIKFPIPNYWSDADLVGDDEQTYLLVKVKAKKLEDKLKQSAISELENYFQPRIYNLRFAMLVDLEEIDILKVNDDSKIEAKISLKSDDVLSHYDPEFSKKRIFGFYLQTLIQSWLRDLAYHWKSETPPASRELAEIGLLQLLESGHGHYYFQVN